MEETFLIGTDAIVRIYQTILECILLFEVLRTGRTTIWPWFCAYLAAAIPSAALWAGAAFWRSGPPWSEMGSWSMIIGVADAPLAFAAAWEAINIRTLFVRELEDHGKRGETFYVFCGSLYVAAALAVISFYKDPQPGGAVILARIQLFEQVALSAVLILAWAYWRFPPRKAPLKSVTHLALLALWFLAFATAHTAPLRPAPADRTIEEFQAVVLSEELLRVGITVGEIEAWEYRSEIEERALRQIKSLRIRWYLVNDACGVVACTLLLGWVWLFGATRRMRLPLNPRSRP